MNLDEVINIADEAYEMWMPHEHLIRKYYRNPQGDFGDSLAQFVAKELTDASHRDGSISLSEVIDRLNMAIGDLNLIRDAFVEKKGEVNAQDVQSRSGH